MPRITVWLMFLAGWFIHAMLQARASVTSKSNGLHSSQEWFALTWPIVLARCFLAALAMELWCEAPSIFGNSLGLAMVVPMTKATAGIFGYTADSVLDKLGASFGIIKLEIPKLSPPTAADPVEKTSAMPSMGPVPVPPVI